MALIQRTFLALPFVAALPAGIVAGAIAGWLRPSDAVRARLVTAAASSVVMVVLDGLWLIRSTPASHLLRILLGWVVIAVLLTGVHLLASSVTPFVLGRVRRDPTGRLR